MEILCMMLIITVIDITGIAAGILIWIFLDEIVEQQPMGLRILTGSTAVIVSILTILEVVVFVRWCINL